MLTDCYQAVMAVNSRDEFRDVIVRFAQELEFEYVSAMTVLDHSLVDSEFITIDNMPPDWADVSGTSSELFRVDPVMQHCKRATVPIIWDRKTYQARGLGGLWEEQAEFGYQTGIALAMHFPEGRHFMMSVDRRSALPVERANLTRIVAELQLFAVHAQDAAMRLFAPQAMHPERPALTPRELEALRWTRDGKTAWEVGRILGISERTAVLHIQNSMRKLDASNKHQAVLKAIKLGLIH